MVDRMSSSLVSSSLGRLSFLAAQESPQCWPGISGTLDAPRQVELRLRWRRAVDF